MDSSAIELLSRSHQTRSASTATMHSMSCSRSVLHMQCSLNALILECIPASINMQTVLTEVVRTFYQAAGHANVVWPKLLNMASCVEFISSSTVSNHRPPTTENNKMKKSWQSFAVVTSCLWSAHCTNVDAKVESLVLWSVRWFSFRPWWCKRTLLGIYSIIRQGHSFHAALWAMLPQQAVAALLAVYSLLV